MFMKSILRISSLVFASFLLTACSGGSSDSPSPVSIEEPKTVETETADSTTLETDVDYDLVEGLYYLTNFEAGGGEATSGVTIYDGTSFLIDNGTTYRFIVNTSLSNGSYEALVFDFDKATDLSRISGLSPSFGSGVFDVDGTGTVSLTATSESSFDLVINESKYSLEAYFQTADQTTDDSYFITNILTPNASLASYIEYNFGYLTIALSNGCTYSTPETIKLRGIVYGQNFISNCVVDFEYFNGIMINNEFSIYDTVWYYVK
jgi:hypothetical protein